MGFIREVHFVMQYSCLRTKNFIDESRKLLSRSFRYPSLNIVIHFIFEMKVHKDSSLDGKRFLTLNLWNALFFIGKINVAAELSF